MKKKIIAKNIFGGITAGIIIFFAIWGASDIFIFSKKVNIEDIKYSQKIDSTYNIYAFPLPEEATFADELIPLDLIDVRESLDYEILKAAYWQSEMFLYFKRANRYFPIIEPILKKYKIPNDFKYLAITESGLKNAVSPSGAKGFWQFMETTGKSYNLEINEEIDERYNIEKSTVAACKYLNDMHIKYKNWAIVAAAYNNGEGNINQQIDIQKQTNYWDLLLNEETGRYVYRIAAIKLIMENPEKYGFKLRQKDLYPFIQTKNIEIDSAVTDFAAFAKKFDISYKTLKNFNPWLRKTYITNTKKQKYQIQIPDKSYRTKDYFKNDKKADSSVINLPKNK